MRSNNQFDEKTILTLIDVFGSCITDVFYNHLYDRAIAIHEKTSKSVTECYKQVIIDYVNEQTSSRFYTVLLNSLHHYVRMSTIYKEITYSDCVTLYSSLFVPQMFIASMTSEQKINLLSFVIKNTISQFSHEILNEHLGAIIDDHTDPVNVEVLQDCILQILLQERDASYNRFVASQKSKTSQPKQKAHKSAKAEASKPVGNKKASTQALLKLSNAFKQSINERAALKKKNSSLTKKNAALANQFTELKTMFLKQIESHKEQASIIDALKKQVTALQNAAATKEEIPSNSTIVDEEPTEVINTDAFDDGLFSVEYVET